MTHGSWFPQVASLKNQGCHYSAMLVDLGGHFGCMLEFKIMSNSMPRIECDLINGFVRFGCVSGCMFACSCGILGGVQGWIEKHLDM